MNLLSVTILGLLIFTLPHFFDGSLTEKVSAKIVYWVMTPQMDGGVSEQHTAGASL